MWTSLPYSCRRKDYRRIGGDILEVEVLHIANHKLNREEAFMICKKIQQLYQEGFWIEQKVFLDKAGTIIVLVKEEE